jgi:hypothetical protein
MINDKGVTKPVEVVPPQPHVWEDEGPPHLGPPQTQLQTCLVCGATRTLTWGTIERTDHRGRTYHEASIHVDQPKGHCRS